MGKPSDLHLGHFCLTAASPSERFDAAARAGFSGITLFWNEVRTQRQAQGGLDGFRKLLAEAGLQPVLMEYIPLPSAEAMAGFAAQARDIAQTSAALGCGLVHAVALRPDPPFGIMVEGLGVLAEACRQAGVRCALEFVPFITGVPGLAEARRLLREVDSPALGLLVDSFHFFRSGAPWAELEALSPGLILSIQVNDGPQLRPCDDYGLECMTLRGLPGDGEFDLVRFVAALARVAPGIPLMAEVVNSELLAMPAARAARIIADSTRDLQRLAARPPG